MPRWAGFGLVQTQTQTTQANIFALEFRELKQDRVLDGHARGVDLALLVAVRCSYLCSHLLGPVLPTGHLPRGAASEVERCCRAAPGVSKATGVQLLVRNPRCFRLGELASILLPLARFSAAAFFARSCRPCCKRKVQGLCEYS